MIHWTSSCLLCVVFLAVLLTSQKSSPFFCPFEVGGPIFCFQEFSFILKLWKLALGCWTPRPLLNGGVDVNLAAFFLEFFLKVQIPRARKVESLAYFVEQIAGETTIFCKIISLYMFVFKKYMIYISVHMASSIWNLCYSLDVQGNVSEFPMCCHGIQIFCARHRFHLFVFFTKKTPKREKWIPWTFHQESLPIRFFSFFFRAVRRPMNLTNLECGVEKKVPWEIGHQVKGNETFHRKSSRNSSGFGVRTPEFQNR